MVVCELMMRVDDLCDLPSGQNVVKSPDGKFSYFETGRIPTDRLLHAISEGRIYARWGSRLDFLEELHPDWAITAYRYTHPRNSQGINLQWPWNERPIPVPDQTDGPVPIAPQLETAQPVKKAQPVAPVATQTSLL